MATDSKEYPNFYENIKEAQMRLQNTVVMYDKKPYHVLTIADGKPDGIFRVYMEPIGDKKGGVFYKYSDIPYEHPDNERGPLMDAWMAKYPDSGVIRKMMNSPMFNKFRPFDLGMCNADGKTYYLERQPQRHTQQGLTQNMIFQTSVGLEMPPDPNRKKAMRSPINMTSAAFRTCVVGDYPSFDVCLKNLLDPDVVNESVAFHRHFALVRGPIDTLFLAYKGDVVGCLPYGDASLIRLSAKFKHAKEVTEDLRIFKKIVVK